MADSNSSSCLEAEAVIGYHPSRGFNTFFAIAFAVAAVLCLSIGCWKRTWSYSLFITASCILELIGYAARVTLSSDFCNASAFQTQITLLILAPTVTNISIYLTLKHVCLALNPLLCRIRPMKLPFVFVPADVSCLLLQAVGGGLVGAANNNRSLSDIGNDTMLAGICLQVVVLLGFGCACIDYAVRFRRWMARCEEIGGHNETATEAGRLWRSRRFRLFVGAVAGAYGGILIRCIYRIIEMKGGWGNPIMKDQASFVVCEGLMMVIAALLLSFFPPGILFPQMIKSRAKNRDILLSS